MSSVSLVQSLAWRHFTKKHSLSLRPQVVDFLADRLSLVPDEQVGQVIEYIATAYVRQVATVGGDLVVELPILEEIIGKLFRSHRIQTEAIKARDYVHVIDGIIPGLCYNLYQQSFTFTPTLFPQDRHTLLLERVQRHQREHQVDWKLTPIKSLKMRDSGESVYCFGMIYKSTEGDHFVMEDPDDQIVVIIDNPNTLLVDGQFVIAHGSISSDGLYHISDFFKVPIDSRRSLFKMSSFPCPLKTIAKETEGVKVLRELELKCEEAWLACFSDLWLDRDEHLQDFEKAIHGMLSTIGAPTILVLLGNFHSHPPNIYTHPNACLEEYKRVFKKLDHVLQKYPKLQEDCKIVMAAGPKDPFSAPNLTPRNKLPNSLLSSFTSNLDVVFSEDPIRIFWFSRELVFTRDDLTARLEKARLSTDQSAISTIQSVEMALSNGTLQPCLNEYQPCRRESVGRLSLSPPPDLVVVAEKANHENTGTILETAVGNPERFAYTRSFLTWSLADSIAKVLTL